MPWNEREFLDAIKQLGLGDDPSKRQKALKTWRSFQGSSLLPEGANPGVALCWRIACKVF
jgi:hypothetical protein